MVWGMNKAGRSPHGTKIYFFCWWLAEAVELHLEILEEFNLGGSLSFPRYEMRGLN